MALKWTIPGCLFLYVSLMFYNWQLGLKNLPVGRIQTADHCYLNSFLSFSSIPYSQAQSGLISKFERASVVPKITPSTPVCSSHHRDRPSASWKSVNKEALFDVPMAVQAPIKKQSLVQRWGEWKSIWRKADREEKGKKLSRNSTFETDSCWQEHFEAMLNYLKI